MADKPKKRAIVTIGDQLKKMRKNAGFTQKEMASRLDIATRTWRDYEKDVSDIGTKKLIKASALCRVNPVRLFESFFTIRTPVTKGQRPTTKKAKMKVKNLNNAFLLCCLKPNYC